MTKNGTFLARKVRNLVAMSCTYIPILLNLIPYLLSLSLLLLSVFPGLPAVLKTCSIFLVISTNGIFPETCVMKISAGGKNQVVSTADEFTEADNVTG